MLGRIILIMLQIVAAWFGAPMLLRYLPAGLGGDASLLLHGALIGIVVWIVGLIGAQALKDVPTPSPGTLVWAVAGGLIGAGLLIFKVPAMIPQVKLHPTAWMLALSVLGYQVKK